MSAPLAYRAAWQVIMSGGTLEAGLEAAEPHFRMAERERIRDGLAAITVTLTRPAFGYRQSEAHRMVPLAELHALIGGTEIPAPGEDAPGRPCDGPGAAGQGAAGVAPRAQP